MKNKDTSHGSAREDAEAAILRALTLIGRVPGYQGIAHELSALWRQGRLRFDPEYPDRGGTDWRGHITIGPEALEGSLVSLAQTLVHEQFHRTQPPLTKTASYWLGIRTRTPVWRRLEQPAYRAGFDFLCALEKFATEQNRTDWAEDARREQSAVLLAFESEYRVPLLP